MALALASQTGSIVNHAMSRQTKDQPEPRVGMGVTLLGWTDRYAGTITEIADQIITVQEDRATRTDSNGASERQAYSYERDPKGLAYHYRFRDGAWQSVQFNERTKTWTAKPGGYGLKIGCRDHFYDFSY